jgi:hypothetical protein
MRVLSSRSKYSTGTQSNSSRSHTFLVSAQFFQTLRIPVREGRVWTDAENLRGGFFASWILPH